ncbi:MAG: riboflavin biosynthesis protein RibF [Clostridia bacterium]|nr:riboflavin biosynthesis protein RibF [Clostridia bacterium]
MKTAVALGTFDGVHKGHREVLLLPDGYKKTAVTFLEPPKMFFKTDKELLTLPDDKLRIIKNIGIDDIYVMDFKDVKDMPAKEFLLFLKRRFSPDIISCGFNYRFGKNGSGNSDTLKNFCEANGIECKCCLPVKEDGEVISSTYIRNLLKQGEIKKANKLLSEDFGFSGVVISGDKRGREMGFPTANQEYPQKLVKVKFGVYKTKVCFEGKTYNGITNIGIRPTYPADFVISETHIKDFSARFYGKEIRIFLKEFIREEKKFSSLIELKNQISKDLEIIKE